MKENLRIIGKRRFIIKFIPMLVVMLAMALEVWSFIVNLENILYWLEFEPNLIFVFKEIILPIIWMLFLTACFVLLCLIPDNLITYNTSTKIVKIRIGKFFKKVDFFVNEIDYVDYAKVSLKFNLFYMSSSGGYITIVLKNGQTYVISDIVNGDLVKEKLLDIVNKENNN